MEVGFEVSMPNFPLIVGGGHLALYMQDKHLLSYFPVDCWEVGVLGGFFHTAVDFLGPLFVELGFE